MSMRVRSWVGNPGHGNRWPSDRPGSMRSRPRWRLRTRLTWPETRTRHQRSFNPETAEPSVVRSNIETSQFWDASRSPVFLTDQTCQTSRLGLCAASKRAGSRLNHPVATRLSWRFGFLTSCLLYTSDAADD